MCLCVCTRWLVKPIFAQGSVVEWKGTGGSKYLTGNLIGRTVLSDWPQSSFLSCEFPVLLYSIMY